MKSSMGFLTLSAMLLLGFSSKALAETYGTVTETRVQESPDDPVEGTFTGITFTETVGSVTFTVEPWGNPTGTPFLWSNPSNWDDPLVYYKHIRQVTDYLGNFTEYIFGEELQTQAKWDDLMSVGPTQTALTGPVPIPSSISGEGIFNVEFGTQAKYNVNINNGHSVLLDQNAILETLAIEVGSSLECQAGRTLTLKQASEFNSNFTLNGTFQNLAPFTNSGNFDWAGGTISASASFTNDPIGTMALTGANSKTIVGSTLTNTGFVEHVDAGSLVLRNNTVLDNEVGAVYDIKGDGDLYTQHTSSGYSSQFNNAGTFRKSGGTGESVIDVDRFNNSGTVEVSSGQLSLNRNTTITGGRFVASNDATLKLGYFSGSNGIFEADAATIKVQNGWSYITGGSSFNLSNNALIDFCGNDVAILYGQSTVTGSGLFRVSGSNLWIGQWNQPASMTIDGPSFEVTGGQVYAGGGELSFRGGRWTGGWIYSYEANGGVTQESGGEFIIGPGAEKRLHYGLFSNFGTVRHTENEAIIFGSDSKFVNKPGAVYDIVGDGDILRAGNARFENAGTFRKSGGTGESVIDVDQFNNSGTVAVSSGTLRFANSFSQTDGLLHLNGGSLAFSNQLNIQGGELAGSGTVWANVSNASVVRPGNSPGAIVVQGNYTQTGMLEIEILNISEFDLLNIAGSASLGGMLEINLLDGDFFDVDDTFEFLTAGSISGVFDNLILPINDLGDPIFAIDYGATSVSLIALESVPEPATLGLLVLGSLALIRRRRN